MKGDLNLMVYKIAIICPYFGKFPSNIDLTFYTMSKNKFIDWYIFTDIEDNWSMKYKNIYFIKMKFEDVQERIKKSLGTLLEIPYKLCDYKPAYGYIFYEYIKHYDFWGYCDVDMLFGDLSEFFTEGKLKKYDKIYDLGHLAIYRNSTGVREGFMGTKDYYVPYKDIFNHKYICVFDEYYGKNGGINQVLIREGYSVYKNRLELADIDIKYRNFHIHNYQKFNDFYFSYEDNKLYVKRYNDSTFCKSVAYAHFQQKKDLPVLCKPQANFIATPKGYFDSKEISKSHFYNQNDLKLFWYIKYRIRRFANNCMARVWQKFHSDRSKYNFELD